MHMYTLYVYVLLISMATPTCWWLRKSQEDSAKGAAELVGTLRELADPRRELLKIAMGGGYVVGTNGPLYVYIYIYIYL